MLGDVEEDAGVVSLNLSWAEAVRKAGWQYARPGAEEVLAFVYAATVSSRVEDACVCLNPDLSLNELSRILMKPPEILEHRPHWLNNPWPEKKVECREDLELFALTAAKVALTAGAKIDDGTSEQMLEALMELFPEVCAIAPNEVSLYGALSATVDMTTNARGARWGYTSIREGRALPIPEGNLGDRFASEVFLQNVMRVDIQRKIEALEA